ncbi:MAG: Rpn family recombination-promoting nuclease/putative transposase [Treponemataceae bacterium]
MRSRKVLVPIPIDPLVDPVFKVLFGTEANKDILMSFLNAVLEFIDAPRAVSIELVPPRNLRSHAAAKETEVDVRAKDAAGRVFQVEVQLDPGGPLIERMIFGTGQLYSSTIAKGESYKELKPVVSIWLLRDRLPHKPRQKANVITEYRYHDPQGYALGLYPAVVVIELKNRIETVTFKAEIERWLFFFAHGKDLSVAAEVPPEIGSEVFMKAVNETKRFNDSWAKRMTYDSYMDKVRWNNALKEEAETQRKQDEAQRKQDEAQRKQDEAQRKQDEAQRKQDEAQRKQDEAQRKQDEEFRKETERLKAEVASRLAQAYKGLIAAGRAPQEAGEILGIDPFEKR